MYTFKKSFVFALLVVSTFAIPSCRVTLVPSYSETLLNDIVEISKSVDAMYINIAVANDKTFDAFTSNYVFIETGINGFTLKDQVRQKSAIFLRQDKIIMDLFQKYKLTHQNRKSLNSAECKILNDYLQAAFKARVVSEKSLK